jgi:O-antigen/teichoic acid export membrane protein
LVSTVFISLFLWLILVDLLLFFFKSFIIDIYIALFHISEFADIKYYLIILLLNTGIILVFCYSLLIGRKSTKEIVLFTTTKFIFTSISSILFLYFNVLGSESVLNRLFGIFIAEFLVAFTYIIFYVKPYISFKINATILKAQIKTAIPLVPTGLLGLFIVMIDRTLITEHHGLEELASYNLAMIALMPIQMLMSATQVAWAPHLFSLNSIQLALKQTINIMIISFFVMIAGVAVVSALLHLTSQEYNSVPKIIIYASFGVIASSLIHLNSNMFVHINKTHYQLFVGVIILAINWIVNILLIPQYSFYGAAIAAGTANTIGLIVGLGLLYIILRRLKYG